MVRLLTLLTLLAMVCYPTAQEELSAQEDLSVQEDLSAQEEHSTEQDLSTQRELAFDAANANGRQVPMPEARGYIALKAARVIKGDQDFKMWEYDRGQRCDLSKEYDHTAATFILADGASISNVIFGPRQISCVLCLGSCTLTNVWFRGLCDEAIQVMGPGTVNIIGGGANNAPNKFVQHNSRGTVTIRNGRYYNISHLYRSCGNCANNKARSPRRVNILDNQIYGITNDIAGINSNFGDTAKLDGNCGDGIHAICQEYVGVQGGNARKSESKRACSGTQGLARTLPACQDTPPKQLQEREVVDDSVLPMDLVGVELQSCEDFTSCE